MMKVAGWTMAVALGLAAAALGQATAPKEQKIKPAEKDRAQDNVLFLNAQQTLPDRHGDLENRGCVVPRAWVGPGHLCFEFNSDENYSHNGRRIQINNPKDRLNYLDEGYFIQGHRIELEIVNRKFLTDYSVTVDAVTQVQTGPNIRNLNEAANLTLNPISLVTPPSKGGSEGLMPRAADKILFDLIDETRATLPEIDLENDHEVIERERAKVAAQFTAFRERYALLLRTPGFNADDLDCANMSGAPDVENLSACLSKEVDREHHLPWAGSGPYGNEGEFMRVNTRVQDLIAAVQTLGAELASTNLPQMRADLEAAISQYENDWIIFRGNIQAALDAVALVEAIPQGGFRENLWREQMKVLLMERLKQGTTKTLDDAEMNALLDEYESSNRAPGPQARARWTALRELATLYSTDLERRHRVTEFEDQRTEMRSQMDIGLPGAIADLNAAQSRLLNRVNYLYDHSEIPDPLPKQIDISGHPGNLVVYYTIRRIENFQRYTVAPVQGPGSSTAAGGQGVALPPPAAAAIPATSTVAPGSAATPASATASSTSGSTTTTSNTTVNPNSSITTVTSSTTTPAASSATPGTVVARGSFEVHDVFHANVVAAVAFSFLKNQSVTSRAQPLSCMGTPSTPDPNCFSPFVSTSYRWAPIVGLDYYFRPRDSFPRPYWLCSRDLWECFGVMGAASATKANNYFLGLFFEPALGVQFAGGANFGTKNVLQSPYTANTPVDITGSFPTSDQRGIGVFVSAGLDLGIFRKIFGKFTGIGTSATGTSGQ
jgi:hypothetical protein